MSWASGRDFGRRFSPFLLTGEKKTPFKRSVNGPGIVFFMCFFDFLLKMLVLANHTFLLSFWHLFRGYVRLFWGLMFCWGDG